MTNRVSKCCALLLVAASLAFLNGCLIVPVPAPTRTSAPPELKNKIDIKFIQPGTTGRKDVEEKLGWSDVGINTRKVFWGRWSTSSSALIWGFGGYGGGTGGADRNWSIKNIVVDFDENGVVQSWKFVAESDIVQVMRRLAEPAAGRFDPPLEIEVGHVRRAVEHPAMVVLSRSSFKFIDSGEKPEKARNFQIAPQEIKSISIPKIAKADARFPSTIRFTLHLTRKTRAGQDITLAGDAKTLMKVIEYQMAVSEKQQAGGPVMPPKGASNGTLQPE